MSGIFPTEEIIPVGTKTGEERLQQCIFYGKLVLVILLGKESDDKDIESSSGWK